MEKEKNEPNNPTKFKIKSNQELEQIFRR